jgi:hypothetical protein
MAFLWIYSGCQKHAPFRDRFFLQPLIPAFRISEIIFKKRCSGPRRANDD